MGQEHYEIVWTLVGRVSNHVRVPQGLSAESPHWV